MSKPSRWNMVKEHFPNKRFYVVGEAIDDVIEHTEENVRKMAAAIDLIEVLTEVSDFFDDKLERISPNDLPREEGLLYGKIQQALKKANGGR